MLKQPDVDSLVPGDGAMLLGMPDIKVLGILTIMCEVVGKQQADEKFKFQTIQPSSSFSCKGKPEWQIKTYNVDAVDANSNMLDYFMSSINKATDKIATQVLTQKIHNKFSDFFFFRNWLF